MCTFVLVFPIRGTESGLFDDEYAPLALCHDVNRAASLAVELTYNLSSYIHQPLFNSAD